MDYATRPTSRTEVRLYATAFRKAFELPFTGPVDPLSLLDKVSKVYGNVDYEIVEESELPRNVPARCVPLENGGFMIQISEVVFEGAYERNTGGYRAHILHEIMHPFADKMGFKPIMNRAFKNNKIPLIFLEKGNSSAGLKHIEQRHTKDFVEKHKIQASQVSKHIHSVFTQGDLEYSRTTVKKGKEGFERLYKYKGKYYLLSGIGTNGFVVSAYPLDDKTAKQHIRRYKK